MANYKSATVNEIYTKGGDKNGETSNQLKKCITYGTLASTDWHNAHNCIYKNTTGFNYSNVNRIVAIDDVDIYEIHPEPEPRKVQFAFNSEEEEFKARPFLVLRVSCLKVHIDQTTEIFVISDAYAYDNTPTFSVTMQGSPTSITVTYGGHGEASIIIDGIEYYVESLMGGTEFDGHNELPSVNYLGNLDDFYRYNLNLYCPILDFSLEGGGYSNVSGKRIAVIISGNSLSMSQYVNNGYKHPQETMMQYAMGWNHSYGTSDNTYDEFISYEPDEYEGTDYTIYPILENITGYVTPTGFGVVFGDSNNPVYHERAAVVIKEDIPYEDCYVVIKLKNFIL